MVIAGIRWRIRSPIRTPHAKPLSLRDDAADASDSAAAGLGQRADRSAVFHGGGEQQFVVFTTGKSNTPVLLSQQGTVLDRQGQPGRLDHRTDVTFFA